MLHGAILLATCLTKLEKEIHCKLQKTCYTLQSRAAICNGSKNTLQSRAAAYDLFKTNSFHSLQTVELSSTVRKCCKPKKLLDKFHRGHVTRCDLPATFLATPLQHKLQRKLHRVTLAVELDSTSYNDCRDSFEAVASYSPRLQGVTCLLQLAMNFFRMLRDKLHGKLHRLNTGLRQAPNFLF